MNSKILLSVLSCCIVITVTAQKPIRKGMPPITKVNTSEPEAFYKIGQFQGKWQEVKRTPINSKKSVDFTDSLLLQFDSNKVEMKDQLSMRMSMKGEAYIEAPYNLIIAGDQYSIRYLKDSVTLLDDGEFVREFRKRKKFSYEDLGKLSVPHEKLNEPISYDPKKLEGKWLVYRRQAQAGGVDTGAVVIKSLEILPSNTIGSATGTVASYTSDLSISSPCKIIFSDANILVITDQNAWEFKIYKADGREFVFGEVGSLLYYAKH